MTRAASGVNRLRRVSSFIVHHRAESGRALVWGVAYPGLEPPADNVLDAAEASLRIDSYRTWMRPATLERYAHQFMERGRAIDAHHDHGVIGTLVESYLTRAGDEMFPANCWVAGVKVYDPEVLAALDRGELKGFSIEMLLPKDGYREHVFKLAGSGKTLRTWELTAPEPTFLSLVKNPATGIPFAEVEMREDRAPWEIEAGEGDDAGVTPLVRCAAATRGANEDAMPNNKTNTPKSTPRTDVPAEGAAAPGASNAARAREARVRRVVERVVARAEKAPEGAVDALVAKITARDAGDAATRASSYTDFAALWADVKDAKLFSAAVWNAIYLLESVFCEILYCEAVSDRPAFIAQAVADFQTALAEVVAEYAPKLEGRAAEALAAATVAVRVGKKLSKASREKVQSARDACEGAMGHLDALLCETDDGEAEAETQADSAGAARERVTVLERENATLREQVAARAADAVAQREAREAAEKRESEERAARTKVDADLVAARAAAAAEARARTAAETRVTELERRVPAPRSAGDPDGDAQTEPAKRESDVFRGVIFGR